MPAYSEEQIEKALEAISDPERFREAEEAVASSAPSLQAILARRSRRAAGSASPTRPRC